MKQRLHNANRNAGPDFPGGANEIVMDSPLYPVRRFAPLLAKFAASFDKVLRRECRRLSAAEVLVEQLNRAGFQKISTLKPRRIPSMQSGRETVSGHRKRSGRNKQAGA